MLGVIFLIKNEQNVTIYLTWDGGCGWGGGGVGVWAGVGAGAGGAVV